MAHSLRDSIELIKTVKPESGYEQLEYEIMAERASSLGVAEKRVIDTIAALKAASGEREAPLAAARHAVWAYFVQRELNGFRRHRDVIRDLGIPGDVLSGLGAQTGRR